MLKKLIKAGEYTHMLLILFILVLFYFTPSVEFGENNTLPEAATLGKWISVNLSNLPGGTFINLILIIGLALYVNYLGVRREVLPRRSYLAATIFAVLLLFTGNGQFTTSSLLLCLLLTYSLDNMLNLFGKQYPLMLVLNASMAISVSSMIIPQAVIFILFIWLSFFTYSVNSWREWVISVIGLILPYLYLFFAWFWNDNLDILLNMFHEFSRNILPVFTMPTTYQWISLGILFLIIAISSLFFVGEASDKIISTRKRMWVTYQFAFISLVALVASGEVYYLWLPVIYVPATIMVGFYVHHHKKSRLFDILLILFIVSVFLNRLPFNA